MVFANIRDGTIRLGRHILKINEKSNEIERNWNEIFRFGWRSFSEALLHCLKFFSHTNRKQIIECSDVKKKTTNEKLTKEQKSKSKIKQPKKRSSNFCDLKWAECIL